MDAGGRTFIFVCGRWDAELGVVDLSRALDPKNYGTDKAVINRPRVTRDIGASASGRAAACGLPVSLAIAPDRIFVVNHGGNASPDETAKMPHGHAGTLAVLDLAKAIVAGQSALRQIVELGCGGPVGCALTPDGHLLVTSAEGEGTEDGGYRVAVISIEETKRIRIHSLRHEGSPSPNPSPDRGFGRFPNPNAIAFASHSGGIVFTANGGTNDVSVLSFPAIMKGGAGAEIARIPVSSGPFGLALDADENVLAVADREDARTGLEGSCVSLIDTKRAVTAPARARLAQIRVGTDDAARPSRPTGVAFSPDGGSLYVTCARSGTLSRLDMAAALAGRREEARRVLRAARGEAAPRGVAVTPDGRFVVVAGGSRLGPRSGTLWILRTSDLSEAGRVTGIGNEPYSVGISIS